MRMIHGPLQSYKRHWAIEHKPRAISFTTMYYRNLKHIRMFTNSNFYEKARHFFFILSRYFFKISALRSSFDIAYSKKVCSTTVTYAVFAEGFFTRFCLVELLLLPLPLPLALLHVSSPFLQCSSIPNILNASWPEFLSKQATFPQTLYDPDPHCPVHLIHSHSHSCPW